MSVGFSPNPDAFCSIWRAGERWHFNVEPTQQGEGKGRYDSRNRKVHLTAEQALEGAHLSAALMHAKARYRTAIKRLLWVAVQDPLEPDVVADALASYRKAAKDKVALTRTEWDWWLVRQGKEPLHTDEDKTP